MSFAQPAPHYIKQLKAAAFIACLLPLARLAWRGFSHDLGANPIEVITHTTGDWTLILLLVTLSITPLRRILEWPWLLKLRRMFGLYAFFYACLHFLTYIWLDQFFDIFDIAKDVLKRPFITVGFTCFLLLIPLAVTSTNNMVKRLGAKRWPQLHRFVYFIAAGGVVHFWWLVKKDISDPLQYAIILSLLFGLRALFYFRKNSLPKVALSQR